MYPAATYYFLTHETDLANLSGSALNFEKIEWILQVSLPAPSCSHGHM
jgi:hypothetical protein